MNGMFKRKIFFRLKLQFPVFRLNAVFATCISTIVLDTYFNRFGVIEIYSFYLNLYITDIIIKVSLVYVKTNDTGLRCYTDAVMSIFSVAMQINIIFYRTGKRELIAEK